MNTKVTAGRRVQSNHPVPAQYGSDTQVRVNGQPERWLVAARLSRMTRQDRERGDEVVNSIQTQDRKAAAWAKAEGHEIVDVTRDKNISGAVPPWERPELGPWLTDPVKLVQYDGIVAYTVDRLSREYYDMAWLRKWAETNRKKLYVIRERLRWPDARDGTLWGVSAERAHEERQLIIGRITDELDALRAAGKFVGTVPFGFKSAGPKYDHRLEPTEDGRRYVPEIYRLVIKGRSLRQIAQWLNEEGVKPPASAEQWWPRTLMRVIQNPVNKGFRCERTPVPPDDVEERGGKVIRYRYGDRWTEQPRKVYGKVIHQCPELVDAATWKRANDALTNRPGRGRTAKDPAMLAGVLHCPRCDDSPMYRILTWTNRQGVPYEYYRCFGRGADRKSCGLMVQVAKVDAAVNQVMAGTFDVPVMEHRIIPGNEAEIEKRLLEIGFELEQLPRRGLPDEQEDAERARLRAERKRVEGTTVIEDRVELLPTGRTYLQEWTALPVPERGAWLAKHGFIIYADKAAVRVVQRHADGSEVTWTEPLVTGSG